MGRLASYLLENFPCDFCEKDWGHRRLCRCHRNQHTPLHLCPLSAMSWPPQGACRALLGCHGVIWDWGRLLWVQEEGKKRDLEYVLSKFPWWHTFPRLIVFLVGHVFSFVQVTQNLGDEVTAKFLFSCLQFYFVRHWSPLNLTQQVLLLCTNNLEVSYLEGRC